MGWGEDRRRQFEAVERQLKAFEERVAAEERAAITAWLRDLCECPTGRPPHQLADAIDLLEHHPRRAR